MSFGNGIERYNLGRYASTWLDAEFNKCIELWNVEREKDYSRARQSTIIEDNSLWRKIVGQTLKEEANKFEGVLLDECSIEMLQFEVESSAATSNVRKNVLWNVEDVLF